MEKDALNLDQDRLRKRQAAHAAAANSDATLWPNWCHSTKPTKPRKEFRAKTPRYAIARGFRAGYGLYS
jgi:hypothetical protein